jgi:hypothetical protein
MRQRYVRIHATPFESWIPCHAPSVGTFLKKEKKILTHRNILQNVLEVVVVGLFASRVASGGFKRC